jgi:hypothetical protein
MIILLIFFTHFLLLLHSLHAYVVSSASTFDSLLPWSIKNHASQFVKKCNALCDPFSPVALRV